MLRLSVGDQTGDERWAELVLFGPDGEGSTEISAAEENHTCHFNKQTSSLISFNQTQSHHCPALNGD